MTNKIKSDFLFKIFEVMEFWKLSFEEVLKLKYTRFLDYTKYMRLLEKKKELNALLMIQNEKAFKLNPDRFKEKLRNCINELKEVEEVKTIWEYNPEQVKKLCDNL